MATRYPSGACDGDATSQPSEARRLEAADLFEQGVRPAEIARQLGVCHQIVSDWRGVWRRSGRDGLHGAGRAGRLPKRSEQLAQVEKALLQGATANGYANDLWTLKRVAEVIQRVTGVSHHPARVWYILRQELQRSWQRTARRALERNEEAIRSWLKRQWPSLKKRARHQNALIVFEDESGVSLAPSVRATWAPRGQTPVLHHRFNYKRLSLAGALAYEPDGSDAHLFFALRPRTYNDETLIEFLTDLHDTEQRAVLLIWDGQPAHRSHRMSDCSRAPCQPVRFSSPMMALDSPEQHITALNRFVPLITGCDLISE